MQLEVTVVACKQGRQAGWLTGLQKRTHDKPALGMRRNGVGVWGDVTGSDSPLFLTNIPQR